MRYQISGKHIDIGSALTTHVESELGDIIHKYAERPTDANITFSKDRHEFICESTIHLSTGLTVNAQARANEVYDSFDVCAQKMEKQLRRYKRRLKDHHNQRTTPIEVMNASSYILASEDGEDDHNADEPSDPIIIAETKTGIKSLSVGEAVMQMELADEPLLFFKNEGNKGLNIVYRRKDGNIGWIDPKDLS